MTIQTIATRYRRSEPLSELRVRDDEELYAGGTDLVPLARGGLLEATSFVDLGSSGLSTSVEERDDVWVIGALTTLAELERHDGLAANAAAVGAALRQAATPQIRNRATVGGNLLQRPRCNYFRDEAVSCWMKGGDSCPAVTGVNEYHGLTGGSCVAVQPSDLASVLVALGATLSVTNAGSGEPGRRIGVHEFLAAPTVDRRSLHTLRAGEVIDSIEIDRRVRRRSTYLKAMDRGAWQFALVGLAAVIEVDDDGVVDHARLVASGVSSTPWHLVDASDALIGRRLDDASVADAVGASGRGLVPLSDNGYKLSLLAGLVRRALDELI